MSTENVTAPSSFAANVGQLLERLECRPIETAADLDAVVRLRYEAYLKEGAVPLSESGRLADRFDDLPNVVNVGVFHEDQLVSALRVHFLSDPDDASPSMEVFSDVLRPYLAAGKRMVDPNRFVLDYGMARKFPHLAYVTVRLSVVASAYYAAHLSIATIRVEHQAFYKRAFFATPAAPPRHYPLLTKKICLMLVDYEHDAHRIVERASYFASTRAEQERLFGKIRFPARAAVVAA